MVQPQERTKEEMERVSLLEETYEKIYVPGEEIDEKITKERKEEIHTLTEDTKKEILEERKKENHSPTIGIKENNLKQTTGRKRQSNSSNQLQNTYKRRVYSTRQKRTFEQFANAFASISPHLKENDTNNIQIDEYNRLCSVIYPICNVIKTQHRCLYDIENGFMYNGKSMCAKTFCALYRSSWGYEGGPWRCKEHI